MKLTTKAIALFFTASLLSAIAQAEFKIGVVNTEAAIAQSTQYMRSKMEAEEATNEKRDRAKQLQVKIQDIKTLVEKEGLTMSNAKKLKLRQDVEFYGTEFQNLIQLAQKQTGELQQMAFQELAPKLREAIELVRAEKNLDLVIDAQAVIAIKESSIDITAAVTEKLNSLK